MEIKSRWTVTILRDILVYVICKSRFAKYGTKKIRPVIKSDVLSPRRSSIGRRRTLWEGESVRNNTDENIFMVMPIFFTLCKITMRIYWPIEFCKSYLISAWKCKKSLSGVIYSTAEYGASTPGSVLNIQHIFAR